MVASPVQTKEDLQKLDANAFASWLDSLDSLRGEDKLEAKRALQGVDGCTFLSAAARSDRDLQLMARYNLSRGLAMILFGEIGMLGSFSLMGGAAPTGTVLIRWKHLASVTPWDEYFASAPNIAALTWSCNQRHPGCRVYVKLNTGRYAGLEGFDAVPWSRMKQLPPSASHPQAAVFGARCATTTPKTSPTGSPVKESAATPLALSLEPAFVPTLSQAFEDVDLRHPLTLHR
jgi:hypothetical protein